MFAIYRKTCFFAVLRASTGLPVDRQQTRHTRHTHDKFVVCGVCCVCRGKHGKRQTAHVCKHDTALEPATNGSSQMSVVLLGGLIGLSDLSDALVSPVERLEQLHATPEAFRAS